MLKVMSQLLRKTRAKSLVMPNIRVDSTDDKFEGATVISPIKVWARCSYQTSVTSERHFLTACSGPAAKCHIRARTFNI